MDITVSFSDITSAVRQQLSIIGKHHASPKGGSIFSTADLTNIESSVMSTFIVASVQLIIAELSPVVDAYSISTDSVSFGVSPSRWSGSVSIAFEDSVRSFITTDVIQSVLNMIAPDIAPKYATDAKNQLAALSSMAFSKQPPEQSTADYSTSVVGKMCNDNGDELIVQK